jgi:hypothetical protein
MVAAECYFLDVGQGTSNVILLGGLGAIVIDCSRSPGGDPTDDSVPVARRP